ncbi:MAG: hypothetical protein HN348_06220 [Proteobacteria bacterium]|jgi:hypothetical protein|nr:hypothetical protein [Pseudomonadota bacterium]
MSLIAFTVMTALISSGCTGSKELDELTRTSIVDKEPFSLAYTPQSGAKYELWLDYDVNHYGSDWLVSGPFDVKANGEELGSWELEFKRAGAPVGSGDRLERNTREVDGGSDTTVTGQIRMGALPASPGPATVSGTWTAKKGTTIKKLDLLIVEP